MEYIITEVVEGKIIMHCIGTKEECDQCIEDLIHEPDYADRDIAYDSMEEYKLAN